MPADDLPEGTDAIVTGAGVDERDEAMPGDADEADEDAAAMTVSTPPAKPQADAGAEPQTFAARVEGLKGQAGDRARSFVDDAKTRATDRIDDVVQMIHDAADEVDAKVGAQYGDYIRRAADSVSGLSESLKDKDVDSIFADARDLVQRAPGVAVGVAAVVGFVVARLARAGVAVAAAPEPTKA